MKPSAFSVKRLFNSLRGDAAGVQPPTAEPDKLAQAEQAKSRGNALLADGDLDGARACYEEALRLAPTFAEASVNLAVVCVRQQRVGEAEAYLQQALALKPALWQAHLHLGVVRDLQERLDDAVACFERAIALYPGYAETHVRLAGVRRKQGHAAAAVEAYRAALSIEPDSPEILSDLGLSLLLGMDRPEEALAQFRKALELAPNAVTHFLAGLAHERCERWNEAFHHFRAAIACDPAYHPAHFELGLALLLLGEYEEGLAHFEKRLEWRKDKDSKEWLAPFQARLEMFGRHRYWQGDALQGRRILVWPEQGFGDALMLLRYLPLLKSEKGAAKVAMVCEAPLLGIVRDMPDVDRVFDSEQAALGEFDCHCSIMSLPYLFGTRLDSIPAAPYLRAPSGKRAFWAERLAPLAGLKVGLAWAGNKALNTDAIRSIPLARFAPLMTLPGIAWINLQKGERQTELRETGWPVHDWMDECASFQDTAALMENLDLIVTVDTSIVHLAGALGRPTWLLNRHGSEWRWLLDRADSPWYPSVRIFRQPAPNDWESVLAQVREALTVMPKPYPGHDLGHAVAP